MVRDERIFDFVVWYGQSKCQYHECVPSISILLFTDTSSSLSKFVSFEKLKNDIIFEWCVQNSNKPNGSFFIASNWEYISLQMSHKLCPWCFHSSLVGHYLYGFEWLQSFIHSCTAVLAAESFVSLFCCEKKENGSFKSPFWMKLAAHSIAEGYFKMDLPSLLALNFATEFAIKFFQLCSSASVWACVWTRICTCASTMFAFSRRW